MFLCRFTCMFFTFKMFLQTFFYIHGFTCMYLHKFIYMFLYLRCFYIHVFRYMFFAGQSGFLILFQSYPGIYLFHKREHLSFVIDKNTEIRLLTKTLIIF